MPHSFSTIWIHAIWATKNREYLINPKVEAPLHDFLHRQLLDLGCPTRIINGMQDHVHLLFLLNPQKAITDVIKQLKGASSHWVNQQQLLEKKFAWQTGFAAYSVSESVLNRVYEYIKNQKEHHRKVSFQEEYEEAVRKIQKSGAAGGDING